MHAVVTGGAGFLGSHLCERLVADGWAVVCVDNLVTGSLENLNTLIENERFTFVEADITDGLDIDGEIAAVLHLASPASPADYLNLPLETMSVGSIGTTNALELARRKDARFVLASTSETYGNPTVNPQPESYWGNVNPIGPRSVYDEAKRFSEALTTAYRSHRSVDAGIVRIFNTYGPRMRSHDGRLIPTLIRQLLSGQPLSVAGRGTQTRSLCYVDDTVEAICRFTVSKAPGPMNIGNPEEMTVLAIAERILQASGAAVPISFVERPQDDPDLRCPDISLARRSFGWEPQISLDEGLSRTISWYMSQVAA